MIKRVYWGKITDPEGYARRMSEKDRIDFIREYGTDVMKEGLKVVFGNNKYTPIRKDYWEHSLQKGRRMVQTIVEKRLGCYL